MACGAPGKARFAGNGSAIAQKRNRFRLGEIGAGKIALGVFAYIALVWFHYELFGVMTPFSPRLEFVF